MFRVALACSLLLLACGKKEPPAPAAPSASAPPQAKEPVKTPAPKGVPQALADLVAKEWPAIETAGKEFDVKFTEADVARAAGDRDKMKAATNAARDAYTRLSEAWSAIYNTVYDYPEDQQAACEKYLQPWNKKVDGWIKKAKGLKEISTVK